MFRKIRHIPAILVLTAIWTAVVTSCSDKDYSDEFTYYDVLLYRGTNDGKAVFATVDPETGTPLTYTAGIVLDSEKVQSGQCIFMGYTIPDNRPANQSGIITPIGYSTMTNVKGEIVAPDEIDGWDTTPFYLLSYSSMYNRVIIQAGIPYSTTKRKLRIKVDETTLNDEMAIAYLYQKLDDTAPTFTREYHIAFDLSEIADQLPGNRLKVVVNNSNLPSLNSFIINLDK